MEKRWNSWLPMADTIICRGDYASPISTSVPRAESKGQGGDFMKGNLACRIKLLQELKTSDTYPAQAKKRADTRKS